MNGIGFDKRIARDWDDARLREKIISDGILSGCALTYSGIYLYIGTGHMIVDGRLIAFDESETIPSETTAADGYGRLRLVIDLSQTASETTFTQGSWDWDYSETNSGWPALTQEDINDGTHTTYELEICVVSFSSSNISGVVSQVANAAAGCDSASEIGISDSGGYFDGSTVEEALQEVGETLANSGEPVGSLLYLYKNIGGSL